MLQGQEHRYRHKQNPGEKSERLQILLQPQTCKNGHRSEQVPFDIERFLSSSSACMDRGARFDLYHGLSGDGSKRFSREPRGRISRWNNGQNPFSFLLAAAALPRVNRPNCDQGCGES